MKTNQLKLKRKKILILSPMFGVSKVFYSQLLEAITNLGKKFNFQIFIQPVNVNNKKTLEYYYTPLSELDGIIAITCQAENTDWLLKTKEYGIPLVLIHDNINFSKLKNSTVVSFIQPDLTGLKNLINHLVKDHLISEISVVMVNPKNHTLRQEKLNIIKETLKINKILFNQKKQLYFVKNYSQIEGKKILKKILKKNPKTEAIVCLADMTAIGIISELKERKINNILVTGFDNIDLSEEFNLTTVDQQLKIIGETALADLNNAIKNKSFSAESVTYIPTTLIKRLSCCKPLTPEYIKKNPLPRFAVYYNIEDQKVLKAVDQMRLKIYQIENPKLDPMTIKFLGKAPLYPLHITLKGIFQLNSRNVLQHFLKEIKDIIC